MKRWPKCACGGKSVVRTDTLLAFRDGRQPSYTHTSYFCTECLQKIAAASPDVTFTDARVSKEWLLEKIRAIDTSLVDVAKYLDGN